MSLTRTGSKEQITIILKSYVRSYNIRFYKNDIYELNGTSDLKYLF